MRTFTTRFCRTLLIILAIEFVFCLPGWAEGYIPVPNIPITSFHKQVVGVAVVTRITVHPVSAHDANYRATIWDMTKPEAGWDQSSGTGPAATDRDRIRVFIDPIGMASPNMRERIKELGLTLDYSAEYSYKATYIPKMGWAVDFLPGSLPIGPLRFYQYVVHDNDLSGVALGPIVLQGNAEGQLSSATSLYIKEAPADFDELHPPIRQLFRVGFISSRAEDNLDASLLTPDKVREELVKYRQQRAAQRAVQEAAAARARLMASGQFCQTCVDAQKPFEATMHPLDQCPVLYPQFQADGNASVVAEAPAPIPAPRVPAAAVVTRRSAVSAPAAYAPSSRPAASARPDGVPPRAWQRAAAQLAQYPLRPGQAKVVIVISDSHGSPIPRPLVVDVLWRGGRQAHSVPCSAMSLNAPGGQTYQVRVRGDQSVYPVTTVVNDVRYVFVTL